MLLRRKFTPLTPVPDMQSPHTRQEADGSLAANASQLLAALPTPLLTIAQDGTITDVNAAAEAFFEMGRTHLRRLKLNDLLPFGSPVLALIEQVRSRGAAINEYQVDLGMAKIAGERRVDVHVAPMPEERHGVVLMLQERTIAHKMDRQLTHQGAARSVSALGAMLAHEIKNPLSGIRGAAQLLDTNIPDSDRELTRLICDETDRIVKLVDRMEAFTDERPIERESVNIHAVLDHVKRVAQAGFGRHIRFQENLRSLAAAGLCQSRPADPGLPESREERRRGDRRRRNRRRDRTLHGVPPGCAAQNREFAASGQPAA